ncbi:MAG: Ig-like domain-containing protein [Candidatus Competibacteraceae bacterium]|nr:Ig-like domain-containing protein [Candidatus Competibacteraceae bacterium]
MSRSVLARTDDGTSVSDVATLDDTTPDGPLTLSPDGPDTLITNDGAVPTSPVLSGTDLAGLQLFSGPIAIRFDTPVAAVGLQGGFFDVAGSTTIEAFRSDGSSLGRVVNSSIGNEFFGLSTTSGTAEIAGLSFYTTSAEPAGFSIDNVTFGTIGSVRPVLVSSTPADGSTEIPVGANLSLTFNKPVVAGTGTITLRGGGTDTVISASDTGQVSFTGRDGRDQPHGRFGPEHGLFGLDDAERSSMERGPRLPGSPIRRF